MAHKHILYMMLVDTAADAKDEDTLLKYTPLLEELATRDQHQPYLAVAHRARGIVHQSQHEFDQAEEQLLRALEIFEKLGMSWQKGRTLYELGELAMQQNNTTRSLDWYSQALEIFDEIDAKPSVAKAKAALEEAKSTQ